MDFAFKEPNQYSVCTWVNPQKSYATKKLHNKKGYISKIVLKTTLQKSYIHRKNYKYKKYKILYRL